MLSQIQHDTKDGKQLANKQLGYEKYKFMRMIERGVSDFVDFKVVEFQTLTQNHFQSDFISYHAVQSETTTQFAK